MLPVDPESIEAQRGKEAGVYHAAEAKVKAEHWWNLTLMGITDGLPDTVGLKERRGTVSSHTCGCWLGNHFDVGVLVWYVLMNGIVN